MAYQKKVEEHAFKTYTRTMKSAEETGAFPKVLLLCGKEDYLIKWAVNDLKSRLINDATAALDCNTFSEAEIEEGSIIASCESFPMMSLKKLVIVESLEGLDGLCEYIKDIPDSTVLVFACSEVDKRKALPKAIAKYGLVYDFEALDDASLLAWMDKRLKETGKSANRQDLLRFAKSCGYGDKERSYTLYNLENDIKKLIAVSDSEKLTEDDFLAVSNGSPETAAFVLLDAAFSDKKGYALNILHNSIDQEITSKETGVILSFLGLLCSQLEIMLEAMERRAEGESQREIEANMGINPYRLEKALRAASRRSVEDLRQNLCDAFQIEKDIKAGLLNPRLAMELYIAKL